MIKWFLFFSSSQSLTMEFIKSFSLTNLMIFNPKDSICRKLRTTQKDLYLIHGHQQCLISLLLKISLLFTISKQILYIPLHVRTCMCYTVIDSFIVYNVL